MLNILYYTMLINAVPMLCHAMLDYTRLYWVQQPYFKLPWTFLRTFLTCGLSEQGSFSRSRESHRVATRPSCKTREKESSYVMYPCSTFPETIVNVGYLHSLLTKIPDPHACIPCNTYHIDSIPYFHSCCLQTLLNEQYFIAVRTHILSTSEWLYILRGLWAPRSQRLSKQAAVAGSHGDPS